MTKVYVLTLRDDDRIIVSVHSTDHLARRQLIDFVNDSPFNPAGSETYLGPECPEDWIYEPTAFELATYVMKELIDCKWKINECEIDGRNMPLAGSGSVATRRSAVGRVRGRRSEKALVRAVFEG